MNNDLISLPSELIIKIYEYVPKIPKQLLQDIRDFEFTYSMPDGPSRWCF